MNLLILLICLFSGNVFAHTSSESYIKISPHDQVWKLSMQLSISDINNVIWLDKNDDTKITWSELDDRQEQIQSYINSHFMITQLQKRCELLPMEIDIIEKSDGYYALQEFSTDCLVSTDSLKISYDLFFDTDFQHRGLFSINNEDFSYGQVFSPDHTFINMNFDDQKIQGSMLSFIKEGVWHIWKGYDHLLFLFCLLLPSVLIWKDGHWQVQHATIKIIRNVVETVTAFTLAHSITLAITLLGIVTLPSALVESVIAFSIIVAAVNNLYRKILIRPWALAFVFGLIHGFGFAGALLELSLSQSSLLYSLLGFNLGIELGQLVVVSLVLPLMLLLRYKQFYPVVFVKLGSGFIACFGFVWLLQRSTW